MGEYDLPILPASYNNFYVIMSNQIIYLFTLGKYFQRNKLKINKTIGMLCINGI